MEIQRGRRGGPKRTQLPRGWGVASRGLFPGAPSKTGELSKTNSRSVEQALSYFTVELWFSAMIFHYRSAEFFFHGLRDR